MRSAGFVRDLTLKMVVCVVAVLALTIGGLSYIDIKRQSTLLVDKTKRTAVQLSGAIQAHLEYAMSKSRFDEVQRVAEILSKHTSVNNVMIFNKQGKVAASGDRAEIGRIFPMKEEACRICHGDGTKPKHDTAVFSVGGHTRVLRNVTVIPNRRACRSCHDPGQGILGVLVVDTSLADMEREIAGSRRRSIFLTVVSFLATGLALSLLVLLFVDRPIDRLLRTISRVEEGDLDARTEVKTRDQIGRLGAAFNLMLERIQRTDRERTELHKQLEEFNEELQREVKLAVRGYKAANEELTAVNRRLEQTNRQLMLTQKQLVQSEKLASIGQLAAGVAHEINNPLAGISNSVQILLEKMRRIAPDSEHSEALGKYLGIIERESNRCKRIVRSLLDFSRQEELEEHPTDINAVLKETLMLAGHRLSAQGVKLTVDLVPDLPQIMADGHQLQQVFASLILNAIEAMPEGGELHIQSGLKNESVQVRVTDTGCGIPEEAFVRIFDPFFTTKENDGGTGLGLSVAYGIVSRHNGRIDVQSRVGEGTTFVVWLSI